MGEDPELAVEGRLEGKVAAGAPVPAEARPLLTEGKRRRCVGVLGRELFGV